MSEDFLTIAGQSFAARLLIGTAGYPNQQTMLDCVALSGAEIVTVSIRRISLDPYSESMVDLLGDRYQLLPNTAGCASIRLTIKDDLTTKGGLGRAMHEIDKAQRISPGRLLLWVAIPSIGGCPWQRLNRRHPRAKARIEQHRAIWRRLWDSFVLAAEKAMLWGAVIVIEWPQQSDYWR